MEFKDKVVLITGAASGIGKAAALAFANEGAKLLISDRNAEAGKVTEAEIRKLGSEAFFSVADVAVFGVPHEEMGEEVKAVVQPKDMSLAGDELEQELMAYCRENISHVKCPKSIDFEEELPRHPTGKLYKRLLKDRYWK